MVGLPTVSSNPAHCLQLYQPWNRLPLAMIHGALPWHPTYNHLHCWSLLHTAAHRWWSSLLHRNTLIAHNHLQYLQVSQNHLQVESQNHLQDLQVDSKILHSCLAAWSCPAVSEVHKLHHLRVLWPWYLPTKPPGALHRSSTCKICKSMLRHWQVENSRVVGIWLEPNQRLVIWISWQNWHHIWDDFFHFKSLNSEDGKTVSSVSARKKTGK